MSLITGKKPIRNGATSNISQSIAEASQGTHSVVLSMSEMATSVAETNKPSGEVMIASQEFDGLVTNLRGYVAKFLTDVRAA